MRLFLEDLICCRYKVRLIVMTRFGHFRAAPIKLGSAARVVAEGTAPKHVPDNVIGNEL